MEPSRFDALVVRVKWVFLERASIFVRGGPNGQPQTTSPAIPGCFNGADSGDRGQIHQCARDTILLHYFGPLRSAVVLSFGLQPRVNSIRYPEFRLLRSFFIYIKIPPPPTLEKGDKHRNPSLTGPYPNFSRIDLSITQSAPPQLHDPRIPFLSLSLTQTHREHNGVNSARNTIHDPIKGRFQQALRRAKKSHR